ncbi:hypothetical protein [Demequina sp. NBRC 110054]|uniref:hypothetical protein n=1 Tax=Demequina sp. NBRC 110054 TaxID=1570343 RepID=UPI001177A608|nr:hypothetical protein [Demequina sp. NBRC 110054]
MTIMKFEAVAGTGTLTAHDPVRFPSMARIAANLGTLNALMKPLATKVNLIGAEIRKQLSEPGVRERTIALSAMNRPKRLADQRLRGLVMAGVADSSVRSGATSSDHFWTSQGVEARVHRPVRSLLDTRIESLHRSAISRVWRGQETRREQTPPRLVVRIATTVIRATAPPSLTFGQGRVGTAS